MIRTSIIGFPNMGEHRDLKTMLEGYYNNSVSANDLIGKAASLKRRHWSLLSEKGVDFIPSGDFSLYDRVLDCAMMLNVIPGRFRKSGLDDIACYFAMARGHQDESTDLKALDMKKWFGTNYHYVVPEFEESMNIQCVTNGALREYREALSAGITTRPSLVGPYTFCTLLKGFSAGVDYRTAERIALGYADILNGLGDASCEWVQLEEPALALDMNSSDRELFARLYSGLLKRDSTCKILLQTYFGDIRDVYDDVMAMPFNAVGLDFIDGAETMSLLTNHGFPGDRLLVAGIVNGHNVWVNDYQKSLQTLNSVANVVHRDSIVIGPSCSLLHVPFSITNEIRMDGRYRKHLAFAVEKLDEIADIAFLFNHENPESQERYHGNREIALSAGERRSSAASVASARTKETAEEDHYRRPAVQERLELQAANLALPLYPTSTIGSFPQTAEVRKLRKDYREGRVNEEHYRERLRTLIRDLVRLQEELGLDVMVHGEFERNDMVEYFGENLEGFLHTENGWVQSYGSRCVKPPVIFGDVRRERPITIEWIAYAQSLTNKPVKGMLTGPVTILNWSFPREDVPPETIANQIAFAIREEVLDLEKAGIKIIQIDEAAMREKLPLRKKDWRSGYLDWAVRAFRITCSGVKPETQIQTHMCYSEFSDIMDSIREMDADVILIESAKSDLSILESFKSTGYPGSVGPGVYDIHSPRVPGEEEMYMILKKASSCIPSQKVWVNPDCGLKTRGFRETIPSLRNMVSAARRVREEHAGS